ncbi:Brp/Blh family beta-carotene 15,15'-dioxygenase [Curtobacterium aetherium]|uniref:Brp/Blh family beta-carotene 15,15'-dioxygenase n=1 Tax=Curtobacterium aetherium TaxID=2841594 RepID=A0ACD1E2M4_9MICO|nr:Brp/Blh family beta-carotene 15,15'-dioxygenase [Curtobacterium sp. L6-1]QWS33163.1 Brp/Blh family beta-carotene 15,15'-dioxygenase [Curtobacterium sp. L6-1]
MTVLVRAVATAPPGAAVPPALRRWVAHRVLMPVTVVLLAVAVACALAQLGGVTVPMPVQLVPFGISVLVFGLPHGALDHLVPARLRPGTSTARSIAVVVALYLVVGSATAALWTAASLLGFTVFIAITWFHWGQGDLFVDRLLVDGATGRAGAALTVAARGALPMLVPFVAQPAAAMTVVTGTASALASAPVRAPALPDGVRIATGAVVVVLVVLHLAAVRRSGRPPWRQVVEDGVLVLFFTVVPPVLAVGLYFTLWHAVRHILRLELTDRTAAVQLHRGYLLAPFLRFVRQAWPITLIAVGMLVVLAVLLRRADLGVYLVLIAALTTPHTVVVTWMDHVQRTWHPAAPSTATGGTPDPV